MNQVSTARLWAPALCRHLPIRRRPAL